MELLDAFLSLGCCWLKKPLRIRRAFLVEKPSKRNSITLSDLRMRPITKFVFFINNTTGATCWAGSVFPCACNYPRGCRYGSFFWPSLSFCKKWKVDRFIVFCHYVFGVSLIYDFWMVLFFTFSFLCNLQLHCCNISSIRGVNDSANQSISQHWYD